MQENLREKGTFYEKIAGEYLEKKGYQILEYNYRCKTAEIDIIARKADYLVFCEVKYRKRNSAEHPLEAITLHKQKKISKAALFYITTHGMTDIACRFDVIGVEDKKVIHIENAFDYIGV